MDMNKIFVFSNSRGDMINFEVILVLAPDVGNQRWPSDSIFEGHYLWVYRSTYLTNYVDILITILWKFSPHQTFRKNVTLSLSYYRFLQHLRLLLEFTILVLVYQSCSEVILPLFVWNFAVAVTSMNSSVRKHLWKLYNTFSITLILLSVILIQQWKRFFLSTSTTEAKN